MVDSVWRMADSLYDLDLSCRCFAIHSTSNEGITHLPAHKIHWYDFSYTAKRGLHKMGQFAACPDIAFWGDRRSGRYLVHRPVLCTLLFANDSKGKYDRGKLHNRDRFAAGNAALRRLWRAVGSHWAQKNHDGGVHPRSSDLSSYLSRDAKRRRVECRDCCFT